MTEQQTLADTRTERLRLAAFLDSLAATDWAVGSLCPGWTVHEVAAHVTMGTRVSWPAALRGIVLARGNVDRMLRDGARDLAGTCSPAEVIARLRETAGSARRPPGTGPADPLVDVLVHGQDIARPLGRVLAPSVALGPVLDHVCTGSLYGARRRLRGVRLVATDLDWAWGEGPDEVRGPALDLLLLATGRPAGLAALTGTGTPLVAERLARSS